jgi:hypothetical protein
MIGFRALAALPLALLVGACGLPRLYAPPGPNSVALPGSGDNLVAGSVISARANADRAEAMAKGKPVPIEAPIAKDTTDKQIAPKVQDVIDEISCELKWAKVAPNMLITVNVTLQVEDTMDVTPSITFTHMFSGTGRMRTVVALADAGGDRKRSFTTTAYLNSNYLHSADCAEPTLSFRTADHRIGEKKLTSISPAVAANQPDGKAFKIGRDRLFTLTGDLRIAEIVRDGQASIAQQFHLMEKPDTTAKTIPTFGATVAFTVTENLTALGPEWTLSTIKYPSDAKGLCNGKRVRTDTLILTFAEIPPTPNKAPDPVVTLLKQIEHDLQADKAEKEHQLAAASKDYAQSIIDLREYKSQSKGKFRFNGLSPELVEQQFRDKVERAAADLNVVRGESSKLDQRRGEIAAAITGVEATQAQSDSTSRAAAAVAGQNQLTTIVLQNLGELNH